MLHAAGVAIQLSFELGRLVRKAELPKRPGSKLIRDHLPIDGVGIGQVPMPVPVIAGAHLLQVLARRNELPGEIAAQGSRSVGDDKLGGVI